MQPFWTDGTGLVDLYAGDVLDVLRCLPAASVQCCVTSPPYYALRDYGTATWEGGDASCDHKKAVNIDRQLATSTLDGGQKSNAHQQEGYGRRCARCGATRIDQQLGLEASPAEYIANMVEVFREVKRVLRDDGTLWLNIGDSYAGSGKGQNGDGTRGNNGDKQSTNKGSMTGGLPTFRPGSERADGVVDERGQRNRNGVPASPGIKPLDMMGIPWMLAFALRADGWYLRSEIIWSKVNPMPESVQSMRWERHRRKVKSAVTDWKEHGRERSGVVETAVNHVSGGNTGFKHKTEWEDCPGCRICTPNDGLVLRNGSWRPTKAHEQVFMFTKSDRYYADGEAVREAHAEPTGSGGWQAMARRGESGWHAKYPKKKVDDSRNDGESANAYMYGGGRNKRSVWTISSQPRPEAHFATFPDALVTPCIQAGTSERGCCPACGAPLVRVVSSSKHLEDGRRVNVLGNTFGAERTATISGGDGATTSLHHEVIRETLGWRPSCAHPEAAEPVPCVVLDPFAGSCTTVAVAKGLGRAGIGIDLNPAYLDIGIKRIVGTQPPLPLFEQETDDAGHQLSDRQSVRGGEWSQLNFFQEGVGAVEQGT